MVLDGVMECCVFLQVEVIVLSEIYIYILGRWSWWAYT